MCLQKWGGGGWGGRGAGAREIRGQEAGEERAGREEKCAITQIIFDLNLTSFQSLLRFQSKRANENLSLGLKASLFLVK